MRQVAYVMHFRGHASRSGDAHTELRFSSIGTSCKIETTLGSEGLQSSLQATQGDVAFFEAELTLTPPDSFTGRGTLTVGDASAHVLRFATVHPGHLAPSTQPGMMAGTVSLHIDGGEGQFASATGFISSTFTLTDTGDLSDYQCGLIFLPD